MTVAVLDWHLPEAPQVEVENLSIEPLRFGQFPPLVEQERQVVHRRRGFEVIGTEQLPVHLERAPGDGKASLV